MAPGDAMPPPVDDAPPPTADGGDAQSGPEDESSTGVPSETSAPSADGSPPVVGDETGTGVAPTGIADEVGTAAPSTPDTASTEDATSRDAEATGAEPESFRFEYDPLRDSPQAIENRLRIRGGIALLGVGAALGAGALAMGLSDPCHRPAGNSCQTEARNRAAVTMAVPAAAMLVGGATLVALGVVGQRRLRASAIAHGRGGGVMVWGRF